MQGRLPGENAMMYNKDQPRRHGGRVNMLTKNPLQVYLHQEQMDALRATK